LVGGRLFAAHAEVNPALQKLIAAGIRSDGIRSGGAIGIPSPNGRMPLALRTSPIPGTGMPIFGAPGGLLVTVTDLDRQLRSPADELRLLFGLTAAEARLAELRQLRGERGGAAVDPRVAELGAGGGGVSHTKANFQHPRGVAAKHLVRIEGSLSIGQQKLRPPSFQGFLLACAHAPGANHKTANATLKRAGTFHETIHSLKGYKPASLTEPCCVKQSTRIISTVRG
jgi:hypothetical protein